MEDIIQYVTLDYVRCEVMTKFICARWCDIIDIYGKKLLVHMLWKKQYFVGSQVVDGSIIIRYRNYTRIWNRKSRNLWNNPCIRVLFWFLRASRIAACITVVVVINSVHLVLLSWQQKQLFFFFLWQKSDLQIYGNKSPYWLSLLKVNSVGRT